MTSKSLQHTDQFILESSPSERKHRCHTIMSPGHTPHQTNGLISHTNTSYTSGQKLYIFQRLQLLLLVSILTSLLFAGCTGLPLASNQVHKETTLQQSYAEEQLLMPAEDVEEQLRDRRAIVDVFSSPSSAWENATVPYIFDKTLPLRLQRQAIKAMCAWMKQTNCVRFVERTTEKYFVRFEYNYNSNDCKSYVGKLRFSSFYPPNRPHRGQPIKLSMSCSRGNIMHELGHTLGFYHEHQRSDRDKFVTINYENMYPTHYRKFAIQSHTISLGSLYDFDSIMHYPLDAFTNNGNNTITPKVPHTGIIGQRKRLSRADKVQANNLYQCSDIGANNDMMPDSADIIKDGNWMILSPLGLNLSPSHRLQCHSDNCSTSECAGRLFKQNDIEKCPKLFISIRKVSNMNDDKIIRPGDSVSLRWEIETEGSGEDLTESSNLASLYCESGKSCSLSGVCSSQVDGVTSNVCPENVFTIRAQGKDSTDYIVHSDDVTFERVKTSTDGTPLSKQVFICQRSSEGAISCDLKPHCVFNGNNFDCNSTNAMFHLQKF